MAKHIETIEKSIKKIVELGNAKPVNYNQIVRWINNKEEHADNVQHVVAQYFMTQRIKPNTSKYAEKLIVLHKMILYAMKC